MGKGTIRENLGDGHYRVALDIDVSHAREQLAAIQAYLAEFQPSYQQAIERKEQAKAALTPLNDRLSSYLATAQSQSETAYVAMQSAYNFWRDLMAAQPAGEGVSFLRQALTDASRAFDAAHAAYHDALLNADNPDLPSPVDAWQQRNDSLLALAVAQGQWAGSVGPIQDVTAVNDAYDQVGVALDNFDTATLEYADAVDTLSADQAKKLSAMNFYQGEFNTAQSEWINTVEDNSGLIFLKRARDDYDQATAEFESKQKALANLLDQGGMPAELARIQADLEKTHKDYRIALDEVQSLTLLKVEKQTARDDLLSKLLPFTEADGITEKPPIVNAWCADLTDTLTPATPVATVEIPGERQLGVRIRPQFAAGNQYIPSRDGKLQPAFASSPEATFWNWALHPGAEKWRPRYRLGRIQAIEPARETCTVLLDPQKTGESTRARDDQTLEVNAPIKTILDPQTGQQQILLPGPNIQIRNGVTTLLNVPIHYMDCGAEAFEVNDHVLVEFTDRDWTQPQVIGFAEYPKPCHQSGLILTAQINGQREQCFLKDTLPGTLPTLRHPSGGIKQGGNLDWTATDCKTTLSFDGPLGRAIPPAIVTTEGDFLLGDLSDYSATTVKSLWVPPQDYAAIDYLVCQRFGRSVYKNGKVLAVTPSAIDQGRWPYVILGAAQLTYQGNGVAKTYLVAALTRPASSAGELYRNPSNQYRFYNPECVDHVIVWAEVSTDPIGPQDWHILHTEALSADPRIMPPTGAYFFSGSGTQFASLVPVISGPESRMPGCDDHAIIRGTLTATEQGVQLDSFTVTRQSASGHYAFAGDYEFDYPPTPAYPGGIDEYWTVVGFNDRQVNVQSQAIVAIDFIGDTEITLTSTLSHHISFRQDWNRFSDLMGHTSGGLVQAETRQKTHMEQDTLTASVTDTYRSRTISDVHITRSITEALGVNIANHDYSQFQQADHDITLNVHRPLFYDLRTGAAVYTDMNYTSRNSYMMDETGHLAVFGVADGGTRTSVWSDQKHFEINITDTDGVSHDTWDWQDHTGDTSTSETIVHSYEYWTDYWLDVGGLRPINASGVQLEHSASSTHSVPWVRQTKQNWPDFYAPLILHCQPANPGGDVVARGHYSANLEWVEAFSVTLPRFYHVLNHAFASHFDLDVAWQTHQQAQHPPKEGESAKAETALEADVTPGFRV